MKAKVFCVGFHKTGTTSMARALRKIGYRVAGPFGINDVNIADHALPRALMLAERYDAFQDNPWPILFRELDAHFPGSKFVLTVRDSHDWIKSVVDHFGLGDTPMRRWIYGEGIPIGHESTYIQRYEAHNQEVIDYFADRPNDLLVMDLSKGDGWDKLCPFLGCATQQGEFPHANRRESIRLRRAGLQPLRHIAAAFRWLLSRF